MMTLMAKEMDALGRMIAEATRVVTFTGAGISTESGIPDFRCPGGMWSKFRPVPFDDFLRSEEARREAWRRKFATRDAIDRGISTVYQDLAMIPLMSVTRNFFMCR